MNLYNIILAFSFQEIAIILLIVLLLFGGRKIPELMRGLGSGIKEFKNASKEDEEGHGNGETQALLTSNVLDKELEHELQELEQ